MRALLFLFLATSASAQSGLVWPVNDYDKDGSIQSLQQILDSKFSVYGGTITGPVYFSSTAFISGTSVTPIGADGSFSGNIDIYGHLGVGGIHSATTLFYATATIDNDYIGYFENRFTGLNSYVAYFQSRSTVRSNSVANVQIVDELGAREWAVTNDRKTRVYNTQVFSSTAPAAPEAGEVWYDLAQGKLAYRNSTGTIFLDPTYYEYSNFAKTNANSNYFGMVPSQEIDTANIISATEASVQVPIGLRGTVRRISCKHTTAGAGTWTLRKGGVDTACSIGFSVADTLSASCSQVVTSSDTLTFSTNSTMVNTSYSGCSIVIQADVQ